MYSKNTNFQKLKVSKLQHFEISKFPKFKIPQFRDVKVPKVVPVFLGFKKKNLVYPNPQIRSPTGPQNTEIMKSHVSGTRIHHI